MTGSSSGSPKLKSGKTIYIVPDTSVYLHCRFFTEVDWPSLVDRDQVILLLPAPILRELDKHKDSHPQRKRRERARRVIAELKKAQQNPERELRKQVAFKTFRCALKGEDLEPYALDRDIPDERILATVLRFARENPDAEVLLVARDGTMSFTAAELGLSVVDPHSIEERDEPDETERELATTKRRLVELESRIPRLELSFDGGAKFLKVGASIFAPAGKNGLDDFRAEKLRLHPPVGHLQVVADQAELLRYASEYTQYVDDLGIYFNDQEGWRQREANTVVVNFKLANIGRVPAESTTVELLIPKGLSVETEYTRPREPKEPEPPTAPRNFGAFLAVFSLHSRKRYEPGFRPSLRESRSASLPGLWEPAIADRGDEGICFSQEFPKLQQATSETIGPLFLVFAEDPQSIKIHYTLRADHMEPFSGELHLVLRRLTGSK